LANELPPTQVGGKQRKTRYQYIPRLDIHLQLPDGVVDLADKKVYARRIKQRLADLAESLHIFAETGQTTGQPSISGMVVRLGMNGQTVLWEELQRAVILRQHDKSDLIDPALLDFLHLLDKGEIALIVPALPPSQRKPRATRRTVKQIATTPRKAKKQAKRKTK
jgi:hypothetical protein